VTFQTNQAAGFPGWAEIEATEGVYDWSKVDAQIAAKPPGKLMGLTIMLLPDPPAWLASKGVTIYSVPHGTHGNVPWFNPWDTVAQPLMLDFMAKICQRYDGKVDYIVIGGVGMVTESYLPDLTIIGETATQAISDWSGSTAKVIDTYAANLKTTPFIMACAIPISSNTDATNALGTVVRAKLAQYPLFGVANYGLNPSTDYTKGFLPFVLVNEASTSGHAAGFQCSTANGAGTNFQGSLTAALNCGAKYVEAWSGDASNTANADAIAAFNAQVNVIKAIKTVTKPAQSARKHHKKR
jgi:hypothetical protein